MRVAAIDCGTNSLRMLVLEQSADGSVEEVVRLLRLVRLGEGVDAAGRFTPAALARTFAALEEYARQLTALGVDRVRFVATSAARDAANADDLLAGVARRLGVPGKVITGTEEARLSFVGAVGGVPGQAEPTLVTDIGGGSTELVIGSDGRVQTEVSLNIGSVRLRERFLAGDPPTAAELAEAAAYVDAQLDSAPVDLATVAGWIGVAGTVTSMAALHLGLDIYDRALVQGCPLGRADIEAVTRRLCATPVAELVSPLLPPLRAEVIAGGALICARIAARVGAREMIVSETDILDGCARGLLPEAVGR